MTITIKFSDNIRHGYGSFEEILKLDNYNDIVYIACYANYLYNLPKLPDSLKDLYCSYNNLSRLPELPVSLILINCAYNKIANLPELPNSLIQMYCSSNNFDYCFCNCNKRPFIKSTTTKLF